MNRFRRASVVCVVLSACAPLPDDGTGTIAQEVVTAGLETPATGGFQGVTLNTPVGRQLVCDATERYCAVRNMPLLSQMSALIDPTVAAYRPVGCYDTSISTLRLAALDNRGAIGAPVGRTAQFEALTGGNELRNNVPTFIPREYRHVSRQYRPQAIGGEAPLGLAETLADFGAIQQGCNPYDNTSCRIASNARGVAFRDWDIFPSTGDHLTADYVRSRLRDGYNLIVAYQRFDAAFNANRVTFTLGAGVPWHKVAISGFRPGAFPLRINDVGSGTVRFARFTSSPSDRTYAGRTAAQATAGIAWPNGLARQMTLQYEDDNPNGQALFVEEVDGFRLGEEAPSRQLWSGTWSAGWSVLAPFELAGVPHLIAYNPVSGAVHFDRFWSAGNGTQTLWSSTLGAGWTHLVPYAIGGQPYFVAYDSASGAVHFDQVRADLQGPNVLATANWGAGFTTVAPFTHDGQSYFLLYNKTTGAARHVRVTANGSGSTTVWSGTWATGFTHFTPYRVEGSPQFLAYNRDTGLAHFDRVYASLAGVDVRGQGTWGTGWAAHAAVTTDGLGAVTVYNPTTGEAQVLRSWGTGRGVDVAWRETWPTGATNVVPFRLGAQACELLYNASSGAVSTRTVPTF